VKALRIIYLILFLLTSRAGICSSGDDSIQLSKEMFLPNAEEIVGIIGHDSSGTYLLKKDYSFFLEKYDANLKLITTGRLKYYKGLRSRNFEKVVLFHDSLYMFISEYRVRKTNLYVQLIDKQTLKAVGDERLIYSTQNVKGNYPGFVINLSWLRNKLLITARTDMLLKKSIIFEYLVFKEGMEKLWYRKDFYTYNHQPPRNVTYTVDEQGNVFLFSLIYEVNWISRFSEPVKEQYIVVRYMQNGDYRDKFIFEFKDKYSRDAKLIAGNNGTFICAGLVSDNFQYGISGVFYQTVDPISNDLKPLYIYNFKPDFLKEIDQSQLFKSKEVYGFDFKNLVLRKNGDVVLLCEQTFDQDYDNVNQILAVGFNSFGDMIWQTVIYKKQSGGNNTSFCMIAPPYINNIKVIYNESTSNPMSNETLDRKSFFYLDNSYLCSKEIDNRGFTVSDSLKTLKNKEPIFEPRYTYDNQNGELFAIAIRYRMFQLIHLRLFPAEN